MSKRTIAGMAVGAALAAAYVVWAVRRAAGGGAAAGGLRPWAVALLVFIGIGVAAMIVAQIAVHIALAVGIAAKHRDLDGQEIDSAVAASMAEDEMDKLIALKAGRIGHVAVGLGFLAALAALALGASSVTALHLSAGSFAIGGLAQGCAAVFLYERGVRHG
ncbi:MAG: hypothetical protein LBT54_03905 [Bifidobacteriaceae bacterium]|nr:hypothetical protein [Bifidobacteriaceae bacterium]